MDFIWETILGVVAASGGEMSTCTVSVNTSSG